MRVFSGYELLWLFFLDSDRMDRRASDREGF